MNDRTTQLIANLAQESAAVKPVRLWPLAARWVGGFTAYTALLVAYTGIRPDLREALARPLFALELLLLIGLIITTAFTAALLSYPDGYQRRALAWLPVPFVVVFFMVIIAAWLTSPVGVPFTGHGPECLICISVYALVPAAFLLWQMQKMASTRRSLAGATAIVAAFGMGAFALRLKEQTDYMLHLVEWHYLPMLGIALLGLMLGRWLLKW